MSRRRRIAPVAAAVALALALAACGSQSPLPASSMTRSLFGPFAGYVWHGQVRSVGATITVPRIASASQLGAAGTWIGSEAPPAKGALSSPFFQIGVNEVRLALPGQGIRTRYIAFWSSTQLDFHPRPLFFVQAGDRVSLSMALVGGRWQMRAQDQTSGQSKTVTAAGGRVDFGEVSWTQEDISIASTGRQASYPSLSGTRFVRIDVNATVPSMASLRPTWMSSAAGTFGPTPLSAAGFAVRRVHPSAAAIRYQEIAFDINYPAAAYGYALERWTRRTPTREIRRASERFARVLTTNIRSFARYRWPADVEPLVRRLIAATRRQRSVVMVASRTSGTGLAKARTDFIASLRALHAAALAVKARMHVPLSEYAEPSLSSYILSHPS